MSDEAFARRFYSDRAELTALGVPLTSQRDEFTGEELYTLRSENYFLDPLELDDDELAALQTALYTLEGKFAYAEPLRLALQNLALGRPGFRHAPTATAERVRVTAPDYSPELAARLSKLEAAISKQRTIQFRYWSPARDRERERRLNPYALRLDEGVWYVVGQDLDRDATRTFRVSRIRSDIRFATRRERDFRLPADFDVDAHRVPGRGRSASRPARRGSRCRATPPGGCIGRCRRGHPRGRRLRDAVREARAARLLGPAPERPRRPARAGRAARRGRGRRSRRAARAAHGRPPAAARERRVEAQPPSRPAAGRARSRPSASASSRRCSRTCSRRAATSARPTSTPTSSRSASRSRARSSRRRSRCSTSSTSAAAATRSTPRSTRDGPRARRQGALRRRFPQAAQADAARGARDPARDRVRRADDRGRRAHAARAGARQAGGDVRPVRARADAPRRAPRPTRRRSCARSRTAPTSTASSRSST